MIKEAQPNKIYTEQFLYLNTDVHILVTCHALFSEEVDGCLYFTNKFTTVSRNLQKTAEKDWCELKH